MVLNQLSHEERIARLDRAYRYVKRFILSHQSAPTGLFPTLLAVHASDTYEYGAHDAWVFDNILTLLSVWGLALAYRKVDDDSGRRYELEQSCVKCMRGLLVSFMRQADRVEKFKTTQSLEFAPCCKFDVRNGDALMEGSRLSIASLAAFLFYLAQFTASGLQIIFTGDEVNFVQNLVYCIERAYRTPDFCLWDRTSLGTQSVAVAELHASSIGMTKAALEAVNGINVFGLSNPGSGGYIYVDPDALNRNRAIFTSMLPRESSSRETDALLLLAVAFPFFSCNDPALVSEAEQKVVSSLRGRYGLKKFVEDTSEDARSSEYPVFLAFMAITDNMVNGVGGEGSKYKQMLDTLLVETPDGFRLVPEMYHLGHKLRRHSSQDAHARASSHERLQRRSTSTGVTSTTPLKPAVKNPSSHTSMSALSTGSAQGGSTPNLYVHAASYPGRGRDEGLAGASSHEHHRSMSREGSKDATPLPGHDHGRSKEPGTSSSMVNNNRFPLFAQSVYVVAGLLADNLLEAKDIDPQGRRLRPVLRHALRHLAEKRRWTETNRVRHKSDVVVQIALLAENERLQTILGTYGIATQTQQQIEPINICSPSTLIELYSHLGVNRKFQITGRPNRPCGSLTTSKVYMIRAQMFVFYPIVLDHTDFYMSLDLLLLIDKLKDELVFLRDNWINDARPLLCLLITENMVTGESFPDLLEFMASLKQGECNGVTIKLGRLQQLISTSCMEHLEFLSAPAFDKVLDSAYPDNEALPRLLPDRRESAQGSNLSIKRISTMKGDDSDGAEEMLKFDAEQYRTRSTAELVSELRECNNLVEQSAILACLADREGLEYDTGIGKNGTVSSLLDEVYEIAGTVRLWAVVRQVSGLKEKVADSLAPAMTEMLVRGKEVALGPHGGKEFVIYEPLAPKEITRIIFEACKDDREAVLQQELLLYLAPLIVSFPEIFTNISRISLGSIVVAMKSEIVVSLKLESGAEATAKLMSLSPFAVKCLARSILSNYDDCPCIPHQFKLFHYKSDSSSSAPVHFSNCASVTGEWLRRRFMDGLLMRFDTSAYPKVWDVMQRVPGLCIDGDKLMRENVGNLAPDDRRFIRRVEEWLQHSVHRPEIRTLIGELLIVLWMVLVQRVPELKLTRTVHLHKLLDHAVSLYISDTARTELSLSADDLDFDPAAHVGKCNDITEEEMRKLYAFPDTDPFRSRAMSPKHVAPTPPFRTRPTDAEFVQFVSIPRGGTNGTVGYLSKAVVRLVQNSVENEGVCYVS